MSDDEYEFAYSDDEGGGGGGGDEEDDSAVKIQNLYYGAKARIASDGIAALAGYAEARAYAESRPELSDWAFKVGCMQTKVRCFEA